MSAYPIDVKAELFSALGKVQRLRHLSFAEQVLASLEILASVLNFEIAILGKIEGETWQAIAIHGTSSLTTGEAFPVVDLPCYAAVNSSTACYQEKTKSSDAAFNYAAYLGRALIVDKHVYGTVHLGRKSPLPRPLLPEEEEFFLVVADSLSAALAAQATQEREEESARQLQALKAAQTAIHLGYWYWDVKTNKTEWSEELFRVYGLEPYSVATTYQEWLNVIAPEDRERCNQIVWGASQAGTSFEMDWDTIQKNTGERRHLTSVGDCIKDAAGNVIAMFGTAQDITAKTRAQNKLRKNEAALKAAQSAAKLGHWYWDLQTNVTEWSEELFRVYGLEPYSVDTTYQEWLNIIVPEDRELANEVASKAAQNGTSFDMAWDIFHRTTGERRHLTSIGNCIKNDAGTVIGMFGVVQDITEQTRAQDLLRKNAQALTAAQAVAKLGHWRWDLATNVVEWSDEYYRLHGYEPKSIAASYEIWRKTLAPEDLYRMETLVKTAIDTKTDYEAEYDIILPNGERRSQYSQTHLELDEHGEVSYLFGIGQDITERKRDEAKLRRSEQALRTSQRIAKLGHWHWDITTNTVEWSEENYRLIGYEPFTVEASYELWLNAIVEGERDRIQQGFANAVATKTIYEGDYEILLPNGELRTHHNIGYPELDENGNIIGMFGIGQDITERKHNEARLRQSENNLKTSQRIAKLGHWRWDVATNQVEWSEEQFRIQGYEPFTVTPNYELWLSGVVEEDRERMHNLIQAAATGEGIYEGEFTHVLPNGEHRSQYSMAFPEFDANGNLITLFGIGQDITERKKLETSLRDRTRDLELAIEVSKQISQILTTEELLEHLVALLQKSFNFYHVSVFIHNEEQEALVLQDASGLIGQRLKQEGKHFSLNSSEKGLVLQAARTRQAVLENNIEESDKHLINPYLPLTKSELAMPMLVGTRLIGVLDLQSSEVNHFSENELRVLSSLAEQLAIAIENAHLYSQQAIVTQKLIQLDKLKSQFLANMSHELRTPLNAILNFSSFVAKGVYGEVNAEQEENLNKVIGSATHLLALINDILDLSKIEAGMMNLFIEDANMNSLFQSVNNTASGLARPQNVNYVTEIAPNLPTMKLDKRRIRQIFLNLLSNAFKFTQKGEIKLTVVCEDNMLMAYVSDTGAGIPSNELELIFEPFKQTDVGVSKGGTGLGLPISRYFAEAHGGKLWVESELGKGTTFYVSLPVQVDIVSISK